MVTEMTNIAAECLKTPTRSSVWSARLGKYVCVDTPKGQELLAQLSPGHASVHTPINPYFKLVFLTAVGGTVLFIVLCLVLSLLAGKQPPPLFEFVGTKKVTFNGTAASFSVKSTNTVVATVPAGATGYIAVTNAGGSAKSAGIFTVLP